MALPSPFVRGPNAQGARVSVSKFEAKATATRRAGFASLWGARRVPCRSPGGRAFPVRPSPAKSKVNQPVPRATPQNFFLGFPQMYVPPDAFGGETPERKASKAIRCGNSSLVEE